MKKINFFCEMMLIIFALFVTVILFFNKNEIYSILFLPSLIFLILKICFIKYVYVFKSITTFIIISFSFVRMVFTPFLIYCTDYFLLNNYGFFFSYYGNTINNLKIENFNKAIFLLCYETFILFFILYSFYKKKIDIKNKKSEISIKLKYYIYILIAIMILILYFYPITFKNFKTIFQFNQPDAVFQVRSFRYGGEGIPAVFLTLLNSCFEILQLVLPLFIFSKINKKKYGICISILILFVLFFIFNANKANGFVCGIIYILLLFNYYSQYRKYFFVLLVLVVFSLPFFLYIQFGVMEEIFKNISFLFSSYFAGIPNIMIALRMDLSQRYLIPIIDLFKSLPYLSGEFFKNSLTSFDIYNYALYGNYLYKDQLLPMIGQGYFYFGYIFSPILSSLVLLLSLHFEKKLKSEDNIILKGIYMYAIMYFVYSSILLNITIFYRFLFRVLILLFICKKFINKPLYRKVKLIKLK